MKVLTSEAFGRAERFVLLNARLIDRLRFAALFRDGAREPVLTALRAYRNADGGFGNALEPDLRGAGSQPEPVEVALRILDELDAMDHPMVLSACDWLASVTAPDGGVPFVLPSVRDTPRAPWWETGDNPPGALVPTASIAGILHAHGIDHPWLGPATDFCWRAIAAAEKVTFYDALAILTFLKGVGDRERAAREFTRLREVLTADVTLDPAAEGDVHLPLDYAPEPGPFVLFDDDVLAHHLDALIDAQSEDGGWTFGWPAWTPAVTPEWRGFVTVERLKTLRAYGRLPG